MVMFILEATDKTLLFMRQATLSY